MPYSLEFSPRRNMGDEEILTAAAHLATHPDEECKIVLNGEPFVSIGAVATLALLQKAFPDRVRLDYNRVGANCLGFLERIGFFPGKSNGNNFPLTPIRAGVTEGPLYANIPIWIRRLGKDFFKEESASIGEVQQAFFELINNVVDHSNSEYGGMICGSYFPLENNLQIIVVDFGVSIPFSLGPHLEIQGLSDEAIIVESLKPHVSRRLGQEHNYGLGLDTVKTYALYDNGCSLKVISRDGFVSVTREQLHTRRSHVPFPGTFVRLCLSKAFLENAIEIDERTFDFEL